MAEKTECCVLTRGEFFISDNCSDEGGCDGGLSEIICNTEKGFKKVGNVSSCVVEITSQIIGKENEYNKTTSLCARTQVTGINISITFNCASRANLFRAMYAEIPAVGSGPATQDFCISELNEDDFFVFSKKLATKASVVVGLYDPMGNLVKTLVEDLDYRYEPYGITIAQEIDIEDASILKLSYNFNTAGYYEIDFLSKYQGYKTLYFKGTNYDSDEGTMFDAVFHKVLFAPISTFDLITRDEFLTLTLSGSVEKQNGSWFTLTKQEA